MDHVSLSRTVKRSRAAAEEGALELWRQWRGRFRCQVLQCMPSKDWTDAGANRSETLRQKQQQEVALSSLHSLLHCVLWCFSYLSRIFKVTSSILKSLQQNKNMGEKSQHTKVAVLVCIWMAMAARPLATIHIGTFGTFKGRQRGPPNAPGQSRALLHSTQESRNKGQGQHRDTPSPNSTIPPLYLQGNL